MNDKEADSAKQAIDDLLETLRKAKALYEQQSRMGCLLALNGVIEFLRQTEEVAEEDLHVPLVVLAAALADLDDGTPTPLLTLSRKRGQAPADTATKAYWALAGHAMDSFVRTGLSKRAAATEVARVFQLLGLTTGQGKRVTAATVMNWREKVQTYPNNPDTGAFYREPTKPSP